MECDRCGGPNPQAGSRFPQSVCWPCRDAEAAARWKAALPPPPVLAVGEALIGQPAAAPVADSPAPESPPKHYNTRRFPAVLL